MLITRITIKDKLQVNHGLGVTITDLQLTTKQQAFVVAQFIEQCKRHSTSDFQIEI